MDMKKTTEKLIIKIEQEDLVELTGKEYSKVMDVVDLIKRNRRDKLKNKSDIVVAHNK